MAAVVLALAAGCGGSHEFVVHRPAAEPATGTSDLVLRVVWLSDRQLPAGSRAGTPPLLSLYGDGRLIVSTLDQTAPGASWPQLSEYRVDAAAIPRLRAVAVAAAGASTRGDQDGSMLAVTVAGTGGRRTSTVPATGTAGQRLLTALRPTGAYVPYRAAAAAVVATPTTDSGGQQRNWPLSTLEGEPLAGTAAGAWCTLLRGAVLAQARQAATGATAATLWRSDRRLWTVWFRPLLPDEPGCAAL